MDLEILIIIMIFFVGMGGAFVQRVSGFGLGIFVMLFLPHFMPSHMAAATVSCLFSCGTSTYNTVKYRSYIPFKTVLPLLISAMATIPVAVKFSAIISVNSFKTFFGVVLICLSIYFLFFEYRIRIRPTLRNGVIAGAIGGALNGLFSTGGPPIVIYLSQTASENIVYFAAIQFYFAVTNIYATVFRVINGAMTPSLIVYTLCGLVGCLFGDILGKKVFDKFNTDMLKKVIYVGMILSGILMMIQ